MHEAYQCLVKIIRAKNRFRRKAIEKISQLALGEKSLNEQTKEDENKDDLHDKYSPEQEPE